MVGRNPDVQSPQGSPGNERCTYELYDSLLRRIRLHAMSFRHPCSPRRDASSSTFLLYSVKLFFNGLYRTAHR